MKPTALVGIVREIKATAEELRPLVLAGAPAPVAELEARLAEGGDPRAVRNVAGRRPRDEDLEGADVLVYVVEGPAVKKEDEAVLERAVEKDIEPVCVLLGGRRGQLVPYVLVEDVIAVPAGAPVPLDAVVARVGARLGDKGYALAAKLPVVRRAVCHELVNRFSRQNGILGAAIFIPGADFPALTLNQIRMVLRIAAAYGEQIDADRALELLGILGAGLGFRAVARQLLGFVPFGGWAVKGGIAYTGTRALGEAAVAYFDARVPARVAAAVRKRS